MDKIPEESNDLRLQVFQISSFIWTVIHLNETIINERYRIRSYDPCRLQGSKQWTGIHMFEMNIGEPPCSGSGLLQSVLIQWIIASALQDLSLVEVCLSVSDNIDHFCFLTSVFARPYIRHRFDNRDTDGNNSG